MVFSCRFARTYIRTYVRMYVCTYVCKQHKRRIFFRIIFEDYKKITVSVCVCTDGHVYVCPCAHTQMHACMLCFVHVFIHPTYRTRIYLKKMYSYMYLFSKCVRECIYFNLHIPTYVCMQYTYIYAIYMNCSWMYLFNICMLTCFCSAVSPSMYVCLYV
jgi:hypothetical protein